MARPATPVAVATEPDDEIQLEKNAGLIMATNNSSIVSKRSVERLYLPEPHFYRYFVRKPQRRSPTINRGYWLRMRAIEHAVRQFLEKPSDTQKIIINLGCGYDPLPWSWLARDRELCGNVKFVDIDHEALMVSKCDIILSTTKMKDLLTLRNPKATTGVLLDSDEYLAIGCDLRNVKRLDRLVRSVVPVAECTVLCIAEVSIAYMHPDDADAVVSWSSSLSTDVTFCLLEQGSPDRPDNPFTATMLKHFEKMGSPLRTVLKYAGNHAQSQRFYAAGYHNIECQSLWELWNSPAFLAPSQRMALDHMEPFDEWEEFAIL